MRQFAGLLAVVSALVACSPGATPVTETASPTTLAPTTTHAVSPGTIPPFTEVDVAVTAGPHGEQLVNAAGRSLYMFTLDDERTSTCEGACAAAWPPLLGDPVAGEGVDQALLGNAERSDGSIQVTYGGHPLYLYSADAAPGDTNGHAFNDVWFLVAPDGEAVRG